MDATETEYDIIFAGAGTAACVIAGRLAAADPTLRILMLEEGASANVYPGHWTANFHKIHNPDDPAETFTIHRALPGRGLDGREPLLSHARCIGGGSTINGMMYNRGAASDYDDWMRLGNPGWGSKDLIPLAKKLETYQIESIDHSTHGTSGPIKVSYGGSVSKTGTDFLAAAEAYPRGRGFTTDLSDFTTVDMYGRLPKYIDASTGRRSDTASCYIYTQDPETVKNIRIQEHSRVVRVLFKGERAVGVEYQQDSVGIDPSMVRIAKATRLVVVSAGSYCSPAILERSGIGAKERLEKLGIKAVVDLPGVGENLNDHIAGFASYLIPQNELTLDSLAQDEKAFEAELRDTGKGLLGNNGFDAAIKIRPNAQDLAQMPGFVKRWNNFYESAPDKCVLCVVPLAASLPVPSPEVPQTYTMVYFLSHPLSIGSTHITSAEAFAPLEVDPAHLERKEDLELIRWAYKWSRELARRMDNYRGEYAPVHPAFAEGSEARCGAANGPVGVEAPEIQYSKADDEALDTFIRATAAAVWHALGTCAMKPRSAGGVVNHELNVYGVTNLKVADMSIAPLNVGANTNNTALIIGEKAAVIIAEELRIGRLKEAERVV